MNHQDIHFNFDLSEREINWLIEVLEYYLEESEVPSSETYYIEIAALLDKFLKNQKR